jgi:hypothetical protein
VDCCLLFEIFDRWSTSCRSYRILQIRNILSDLHYTVRSFTVCLLNKEISPTSDGSGTYTVVKLCCMFFFLLKDCTNCPGYYPADEQCSEMTFTFWCSFQVHTLYILYKLYLFIWIHILCSNTLSSFFCMYCSYSCKKYLKEPRFSL